MRLFMTPGMRIDGSNKLSFLPWQWNMDKVYIDTNTCTEWKDTMTSAGTTARKWYAWQMLFSNHFKISVFFTPFSQTSFASSFFVQMFSDLLLSYCWMLLASLPTFELFMMTKSFGIFVCKMWTTLKITYGLEIVWHQNVKRFNVVVSYSFWPASLFCWTNEWKEKWMCLPFIEHGALNTI